MIAKFDELPCHQIVSTFDEVYTTDQEWYDRLWLTAHDNSDKIPIDCASVFAISWGNEFAGYRGMTQREGGHGA